MTNLPLVSVGIPTYNRPEGLRRTLECITQQTYANLEIIVSDNCSPNPEVEIIVKGFISKDNRITYYKQKENFGATNNFKFVLEKASGDYFMWAADDDEWDFDFITELIEIHKMKNVGLVSCETEAFQPNREQIKKDDLVANKFNSNDKFRVLVNFMCVHHWTYHKADLIYGIFKTNVLRENFHFCEKIHLAVGSDIVLLVAVIADSNIFFIEKKLRKRMSSYYIDYKSTPTFNISRILRKYRNKKGSNFYKILEFERMVDYIIDRNFNYPKKLILKMINMIYRFHLNTIL